MFFFKSFVFILSLCTALSASAGGVLTETETNLYSIDIDQIEPITTIGDEPDMWTFTIPNEVVNGSISFTPSETIENFVVTGPNQTNLVPGVYDFTVSGQNGGYTVTTVSSVPVPAAVWLMGSGLIGLVSFGKRRIE